MWGFPKSAKFEKQLIGTGVVEYQVKLSLGTCTTYIERGFDQVLCRDSSPC